MKNSTKVKKTFFKTGRAVGLGLLDYESALSYLTRKFHKFLSKRSISKFKESLDNGIDFEKDIIGKALRSVLTSKV